MTQAELIKQARRAYLITLNNPRDGMGKLRYAIYVDGPEGLSVLWPSDSDKGKGFKDRLPYQCYTQKRQYPAFHFALAGCGYSKNHALATEVLRKINPEIIVETITGWSPSRVSM